MATKTWSIILGVGLVILGLSGLGSMGGTWIAWLDIVGGVFGIIAASSSTNYAGISGEQYPSVAGLASVTVGLFAMWIIGLATQSVTTTMSWWNFGFGVAFGLLAVGTRRAVVKNPVATNALGQRPDSARNERKRAA